MDWEVMKPGDATILVLHPSRGFTAIYSGMGLLDSRALRRGHPSICHQAGLDVCYAVD